MLVREGVRVDEDELTRAVFGLLRYLPHQIWFEDFLHQLQKRNPPALSAIEIWSNPKVKLWPSYPIPDDWKSAFWRPKPKRGELEIPKGTICPDAVIDTDDWLMFVESEYSHDLDSEQMFQQFAIASHESQGKDFFVLLVNRTLTRPYHCGVYSERLNKPEADSQPEDSIEEFISKGCTRSLGLSFSEDHVRRRFLWINWQSIQGILTDLAFDNNPDFCCLPGSFQKMIKLMRDDVSSLLENQGLIPIGFDLVQDLAELCISENTIPYLPVVIPVAPFLAQLEVQSDSIPKWHDLSDIQKSLGNIQLWLDSLPEPFPSKGS